MLEVFPLSILGSSVLFLFITEWQSFRREVGAGSSRLDDELDIKINSETKVGAVREKSGIDQIDSLNSSTS